MRITFCGTGGGPFTAERASSGYVLQHDGRAVMLDCGPGSVRQAMRAGITPHDLDAVILSHLHLDHMLDISAVAFQSHYHAWRPAPLILGPPGSRDALAPFVAFGPPNERELHFGEIIEVEGDDQREVAGFVVRSEETPHAPALKAFSRRLDVEGHSLVFSGDTAANPELMSRLAAGASVLLHECFSEAGLERYAAGRPPELRERLFATFHRVHSPVEDVARIAQAAGAGRLVLTHLLPTEQPGELLQTAGAFYHGEVIVAHDGMMLDV